MSEVNYLAVTLTTHINVLGIDFTKDAFKMVSGFTILGLAIGLGFVVFLFKQSYSDSKKTASLLNEVESEYQDYRGLDTDRQTTGIRNPLFKDFFPALLQTRQKVRFFEGSFQLLNSNPQLNGIRSDAVVQVFVPTLRRINPAGVSQGTRQLRS